MYLRVAWCGVVCVLCVVCCLGRCVSVFLAATSFALVELSSQDRVQQRFEDLIVKFSPHDIVQERLEEQIIMASSQDSG